MKLLQSLAWIIAVASWFPLSVVHTPFSVSYIEQPEGLFCFQNIYLIIGSHEIAPCSFQHNVPNSWLRTAHSSLKGFYFYFFLLQVPFTLAMLDLWFFVNLDMSHLCDNSHVLPFLWRILPSVFDMSPFPHSISKLTSSLESLPDLSPPILISHRLYSKFLLHAL